MPGSILGSPTRALDSKVAMGSKVDMEATAMEGIGMGKADEIHHDLSMQKMHVWSNAVLAETREFFQGLVRPWGPASTDWRERE